MASLIQWTSELRQYFTQKDLLLNHQLHLNPLFDDEGLIALIDRYPFDKLEVFTMGYNPQGHSEWYLGRRGTLDGASLMQAVKSGRIWLNLRKCNHADPAMAKICNAIFAELEKKTDIKTLKHDLGLLISSPNAHVYYHLDMPLVMLWQIRGIKRVYLYPAKAPYARDFELEAITLRESDEQLKLNPDWDKDAFVHDLIPGEFLTWQQNAPHRIVNQDCVNVSLSIEFMTPKAIWRANVLYANGCLRRYFGLNPSIETSPKWLEPFKVVFARLIKVLGGFKGKKSLPVPRFSLNASQLGKIKFDAGVIAPETSMDKSA